MSTAVMADRIAAILLPVASVLILSPGVAPRWMFFRISLLMPEHPRDRAMDVYNHSENSASMGNTCATLSASWLESRGTSIKPGSEVASDRQPRISERGSARQFHYF